MIHINFNKFEPFSLNQKEKYFFFFNEIKKLTNHHYANSEEFKKILNFTNKKNNYKNLEDVPFLPIHLFKEYELMSVPKNKIFKTLNSSGTSGKKKSKIFLDSNNARNQQFVLSKILKTIIGNKRLPMLIIDKNPKNIYKSEISAKLAAINGFSIFGREHSYLLNEKGEIDYLNLNIFLEKYGNTNFLIFGFTSTVYENLFSKINLKNLKNNFSNGILIHGGGWKKMESIKVSNAEYKKKLFNKVKLKNIYNYYGLVEQTGSIFIECQYCNDLTTSIFSEVIIRDKYLNVATSGQKGFIQVMSLLPTSYPGHSILTEDIGEIITKNSCVCSKYSTRFKIHGRLPESEIRGCSNI
jgi:phenylacetate-coenzyme A ligase PaaK-like adenylate-forming protein